MENTCKGFSTQSLVLGTGLRLGLGLGLRSELQGIHSRSLRIAKEEAHPAQRRVGLLLEVLEY